MGSTIYFFERWAKEFQQLKNQISKNMLLTKYAEKTIYKLNKNKKLIS